MLLTVGLIHHPHLAQLPAAFGNQILGEAGALNNHAIITIHNLPVLLISLALLKSATGKVAVLITGASKQTAGHIPGLILQHVLTIP